MWNECINKYIKAKYQPVHSGKKSCYGNINKIWLKTIEEKMLSLEI